MSQQEAPTVIAIADLKAIPPLPDVAAEILQTLGDEFVSGDQIADIVGQDPAVSARLLGLANSAYYGLAQPTTEMRDVVNRVLGADTARLIAFGLATSLAFPTTACAGFDSRGHWRRALAVASTCRSICQRVPTLDECSRSHAYLMGLCADIGLLALVYLEPASAQRALEALQREPERPLAEHLLDEFGQTQMDVTAQLARHWDLPALIIEAYCEQQQPLEEQSGLALALSAAIDATDHEDNSIWSTEPFHALGIEDEELRGVAMPSSKSSKNQDALGGAF